MSHKRILRPIILAIALLLLVPQGARSEEAGLITKPSKYSVRETIDRFEAAITAKGWMVFTELDHAAAAAKYGLELRPRTVIVFGNPKVGTERMRTAPTWAIEVPPRALVWQDDQDKVWLTYNSGKYFSSLTARHGFAASPDASTGYERFMEDVSNAATK